jgi:hypothetical protein
MVGLLTLLRMSAPGTVAGWNEGDHLARARPAAGSHYVGAALRRVRLTEPDFDPPISD